MNIPLHCLNSRWSCHVYTFINKNGPNSSYCDMCGTRKKQLKNHLRLMEPLICNLEVLLQALLLRFLIRLKVIKLHKHVVSFLHLFAQMFHKKFTDLCDNEEEYKDNTMQHKYKEKPLVLFNVSLNSGRVVLHDANHGESLHFNFDMDEVLSDDTKEKYLDRQVKRNVPYGKEHLTCDEVIFDESGVTQGKHVLFLSRSHFN